ncbi:hypothetical protein LTR53_020034, partial [Teratosphaeriaceae sp. CCFEE 6253]
MQASLPGFVQMVSVDDVGQGSESIRILGVRWLPSGAAGRSVGENGKLKTDEQGKGGQSDRTVPGEGEVDNGAKHTKGGKKDDSDDGEESGGDGNGMAVAEGMEAEEGDFINLEVA